MRVEDVLGREPVVMELDRVGAYLAREAVVLVSGAGGSIGAELCRQIAHVGPRRLVLLDHAEDNLFAIHRELLDERHVPPASLAAVLGDCKEEERMREVLAEHRPTVVFHAAAYKHVGLMEANPVEAVRNNAIATRVMAHVCGELGVERFVLVSTDKAVAPATVMGASKALAELALEGAAARWAGHRVQGGALRQRARLLRQRGADLPPPDRARGAGDGHRPAHDALLHDDPRGRAADHPRGLARPPAPRSRRRPVGGGRGLDQGTGGCPVEDAAGGLGQGDGTRTAEVLVLDMGEPVRIVELARAMIELSGLDPDRDIEIEEVGRRPGEKLHEELFNELRAPAADRHREDPARRALAARAGGGGGGVRRDQPARAGGRRRRAGREGRRPDLARAGARERARGARAGNRIRGACAPHTLWRRMIALLPALSLSNKLLEVGALAAFAALVGIAILSLLVFSQARELKRLREWAGRAPERAAELEQRVAAEAAMRAQRPAQPVVPRATPMIARAGRRGQPPRRRR